MKLRLGLEFGGQMSERIPPRPRPGSATAVDKEPLAKAPVPPALSRIEAADSKSGFSPVDLTRMTREVGEQFASRAEQTGRSFTMQVPDHSVTVSGNEMHLRQVMINLLENALKFTPPDGRISLDLDSSTEEAQLTVADSGIGIPSEDLPHVFERFHRGRNAAEYSGNGLGLAIVKAIVTQHHGRVVLQSKAGNGTLASVTLPMQPGS